ncbi:MAG TPA: PAS domain S-box protein, partial [Candidatus Sulfotelmatobacter sp.]|nr:PAS domain S-box protein [Candidatus Sulfotelmatobacter sp.]
GRGPHGEAAERRAMAEAQLRRRSPTPDDRPPDPAPVELRHELEVHQIELEMQNEELRRIQVELEASRAKYFDLYDLAPGGYLTVTETNEILEANVTAAALLGVERRALLGQPVTRFLAREDQDEYYRCRRRLLGTWVPQQCEVRILSPEGAPPRWVRLDTNLAPGRAGGKAFCRVILTDITDRKAAEAAFQQARDELEQRVVARTAELADANARLLAELQRREQAEADLRRSREKFATAFQASPDAIALTTLAEGRLLEANDGLCRLLGCTRAEILGRTTTELGFWADPADREWLRQAIASGQLIRDREFRFATKAGQALVGAMSAEVIDLDGEPVLLTVTRDITAQKQAGEALNQYRLLADTTRDLILFLRPEDGGILRANQAALRTYGYTAEEFARLTVWDLRAPETHATIPEELEAAAAGGLCFETVHRRKDGSCFPVEVSAHGSTLTGTPVLLSIIRDISRRKRAEEALASERRLLAAVLEQAADPIFVVDPGAMITLANSALRQLVGEDLRDQPLATLLERLGPSTDSQGRAVPYEQRATVRALRGETVLGQHRRGWRAGGARHEYLVSAAPIRGDGGAILGAVALLTDVTAEMDAAAKLQAALIEKEAALATNQTLLREVHHRVKNNLQMLCDLMFLQMETMPDREQHQDLQDAYGRIYAIARLHEQIYQAMEGGRIRLEEYLARLAGGFEDFFPHVPVKVEAAAGGVALDLDRAIHVGLIVNELITNALKHAFPKGQPGQITVALNAVGDSVRLQVCDNGRGLPADFNLEQARSVGLRTVYVLAKRLAAEMSLARNGGTTFTLTFPLHADEPVEPK